MFGGKQGSKLVQKPPTCALHLHCAKGPRHFDYLFLVFRTSHTHAKCSTIRTQQLLYFMSGIFPVYYVVVVRDVLPSRLISPQTLFRKISEDIYITRNVKRILYALHLRTKLLPHSSPIVRPNCSFEMWHSFDLSLDSTSRACRRSFLHVAIPCSRTNRNLLLNSMTILHYSVC